MTLADGFHDVPPGKLAMVVTYLEMTAPQLRGVPCPDDVTFGPLEPDIDAYRDLFRRVGEDWLWFGRLGLDDDTLRAILKHPRVELYTLRKDGQAEALLELDFREDGACELAYFGLTSDLIGAGAGAFLMDRAIERAFDGGAMRFHLHTCTIDSPQALGFYIRSGFTPTKRAVEIANDPRRLGIYPAKAGQVTPLI